jgi:ankyrin repeat protein
MTDADKWNAIYTALLADDRDEFARLLTVYPERRYDGAGDDGWMNLAASRGKLWAVRLLVEQGADVNKPSNSTDSVPSPEGPIVGAAESGNVELVRYMLDLGARVNHPVNGQTRCYALSGAAMEGQLEVVKLLIERGADVNASWARKTALDHAEGCGQPEIAAYLRSVGGKTADELTGMPPRAAKQKSPSMPRLKEGESAVKGQPLGKWRMLFKSNLALVEEREYGIEYEFGPPATAEQIAAAEKAIGVKLPADVREMLSEFNGVWDIGKIDRELGNPPDIAFLDTWYMSVKVPDYLADTDNPLPSKKALRKVVWVAQSNGFGDLWGVCIEDVGKHKAGAVVQLDHEVGDLEKCQPSLSEFVRVGRHRESK